MANTNNQQNGRSIAIWGEQPHPSNGHASLNIHFNYWHIRSQKSDDKNQTDFFDLGVKATGCQHLSRVLIYIPFLFEIGQVEDLGKLFSDKVIASGIFNESLSVTTDPNYPHIKLTNAGNISTRVFVFKADDGKIANGELSLCEEGRGTLLEISQSALANGGAGLDANGSLYFRIRIRIPTSIGNPFSRLIKPGDSVLLSSFDYIEFLDFRLNEARNLPQNVNEMMRLVGRSTSIKSTPISRVDFLVVVGEAADVTVGVDSHKRRLLENELWKNYVQTSKQHPVELSDGMVIYHWKKTLDNNANDIGDFCAFIKLKVRRSGLSLVLRYLAVVAFIGCVGSLLASLIWSRLDLDRLIKPADATATDSVSVISTACAQAVEQMCRKEVLATKQVAAKVKINERSKGNVAQSSGEGNQ